MAPYDVDREFVACALVQLMRLKAKRITDKWEQERKDKVVEATVIRKE